MYVFLDAGLITLHTHATSHKCMFNSLINLQKTKTSSQRNGPPGTRQRCIRQQFCLSLRCRVGVDFSKAFSVSHFSSVYCFSANLCIVYVYLISLQHLLSQWFIVAVQNMAAF